ncbi:ABC transporter permease [Mycobacterium persicum]|nr:ABC transporter permease [Mycobacterium persicum]
MSAAVATRARFPRAVANLDRYGGAVGRGLEEAGRLAWFSLSSFGHSVHALRYYRQETLRQIIQTVMGAGAVAYVGGAVGIGGFVALSGASLVAIQGFVSLGNIGVESFTAFFAAIINVRIAVPVIGGILLASIIGAGHTAELGAMRISEEIDAMDVMGVKSISYLVSTRVIAGVVAVVPLYAGLVSIAFLSPQVTTTLLYGQSYGTYEHYFRTFLRPEDAFYSFVEIVIIAMMVMVTHCYYGYRASGGPVGVGEAVGRSMRFSLVSIQVVVLLGTLAMYGANPNFALTV